MYEDGAAAQDGRLWAGDQILEVSERPTSLIFLYYSALRPGSSVGRHVTITQEVVAGPSEYYRNKSKIMNNGLFLLTSASGWLRKKEATLVILAKYL